MRTLEISVILTFDDDGRLDAEYIRESIEGAIKSEAGNGEITPHDDGHATLVGIDIGGAQMRHVLESPE